jgi:hypothetical protein
VTGPRPMREWRDVDRARFENEVAPLGEPAILRGLVADWPAAIAGRDGKFADYLRGLDLGAPCEALIGPPSARGRLFYNDDLSGMNFERHRPSLAAFVDRLVQAANDPAPPAIAAQALQIPQVLPGFAAENRLTLLDSSVAPRMWIGNRVTVACHYDMMRNIACVVSGRRRFTLFPPEQVRNLYIGPIEFTPAGAPVSMVDFDAPDVARFPDFAKALEHAQVADLAPGDAIYIPYMWWHHVRSLDPVSALVNYWWDPAGKPEFSPVAALLHGLLAVRELPDEQRRAWQAMFEQFVFKSNGDPMPHLPAHQQGGLGRFDLEEKGAMREAVLAALTRKA